jgi:hypothetical protein
LNNLDNWNNRIGLFTPAEMHDGMAEMCWNKKTSFGTRSQYLFQRPAIIARLAECSADQPSGGHVVGQTDLQLLFRCV